MRIQEALTLILIAACFLVAGYYENSEPVPHYAQVDCNNCHTPNLKTYSDYAAAWPCPRSQK